MKRLARKFALVVAMMVAGQTLAQPTVRGGCLIDPFGKDHFCSPPNGEIYKLPSGQFVCGKGQCFQDMQGQIICSAQPGGYTFKEATGRVLCTGGCELASAAYCQRPQ